MNLDIINITGKEHSNKKISICVTTYSTQSYYTHACLESIRKWKNCNHEVIVACHDQSLLLEYYLKACKEDGLIDKLLFTPSGTGHTMGVNLCVENASGDIIFNIANDIIIGQSLVDDCAYKLENDHQIGLIGWHWYNDGTFWSGDKITNYKLRDDKNPYLSKQDEMNIQAAPWYTGKAFAALSSPYWLCLCNTAFFGIRKELWNKIGGFSTKYRHYWADDFLNYAVLDSGKDIRHFEKKFRNKDFFHEFQYSNVDREDRHRNDDTIKLDSTLEKIFLTLEGGLSIQESQLLFQIAKSIKQNSVILNVGLWRGTSLFIFMEANKNRKMHFIGIDCFDDGLISKMSGQPPVSRKEVISYMQSFIGKDHTIQLIKENTLKMTEFPKSDLIFIDAGHTAECVKNDILLAKAAINENGIIICHDYNQPIWPDVKKVIDSQFDKTRIKIFGTIAVIQ